MELDIQDREPATQQHTVRAKIFFIVMVVAMPFLSSLAVLLVPIYGCLMEGPMSPKMIVVMSVLWVFCAVAWVPYVNLGVYFRLYNQLDYKAVSSCIGTDTRDQVNGLAPAITFAIFCAWGVYIAFRHFAIADSYEKEEDRSDVQRLQTFVIEPPAVYYEDIEEGGVTSRKKRLVSNALQLYAHLKGQPMYGHIAAIAAVLLAGGTAAAARIIPRYVSDKDPYTPVNVSVDSVNISCKNFTLVGEYPQFELMGQSLAEYIYIFSTIYFCGMFLVFYMTLSFVIIIYLHQMMFIRRITYAADEKINTKRKSMAIAAVKVPNPSHLRAWDEVRRVALLEMTNSKSLLNSFFTPAMVLSAVCSVFISAYLIVSVLFKRSSVGQLAVVMIALLLIFVTFMMVVVAIAKVSQRHMKRHTTIVARNAFDIARELDRMTTNRNEGMPLDAHQSKAARRVVSQALNFTDAALTEGETLPGFDDTTQIDRLEEVLHSVSSLCTYMVANQPRPLILGIQLRYVRYVVVYVLLISAILIFFALMLAFKRHCTTN